MTVRKPYVTWTIKDEDYKLRLSTRQVCDVVYNLHL